MIAVAARSPVDLHHALFVNMLPQIQRFASYYFRKEPRAAREDLIAEVVASAYLNFARLVERNKLDVAYPTPLARFAVKQIRAGRRVGNRSDIRDLLSSRAQRAGTIVGGLLELDERGRWQELLVEDRKTRPADIAACRIDFRNWLATLNVRDQKVAEALAAGSSTGEVAERFGISPGRVSQLRRELHEGWCEFHGELAAESA